ncbi:MAG: hypothetical protein H6839_10385 [Planctomycetes bacterium]|nr:hypothetical protein [Planctomycetota bacterium]
MRRLLLLPVLALIFTVPTRADEEPRKVNFENIDVSGTVTDADGKPAAGVPVADYWTYDGAWKANGDVVSDAEGKFTLSIRTFPDQPARAYRVMAADAGRAAVVLAKVEELKAGVALALKPLVRVSAKLAADKDFPVEDGGYVNFYWKAPQTWMASTQIEKGAFSALLPAGSYSYMFRANAAYKYSRGSFDASGEKAELPAIELVVNPIARAYGKQAPAINISYVRNLPAELEGKGAQVTLAAFKGRWVLLDFWGFW